MKLELAGVTFSYGTQRVLREASLRIDGPSALVLLGPSGSGKSTLLRLLGGLEAPESGTIALGGEPLPRTEEGLLAYRRTVGTVFQAFNLFPHLTALENITLPLEKVHGLSAVEARARALEQLARFRLETFAQRKPGQLSGGQRQRVALARALSIRPRLLLFDEPTSALDPEMTDEVLEAIAEVRAEGRDLILVTHHLDFARRVADEVAIVEEGRIADQGPVAAVLARRGW